MNTQIYLELLCGIFLIKQYLYIRFDCPTGPLYTLNANDIFPAPLLLFLRQI